MKLKKRIKLLVISVMCLTSITISTTVLASQISYAQDDLDTVYNDGTVKKFGLPETSGVTELLPFEGNGIFESAVVPVIPAGTKYISDRISGDNSETIIGSDNRTIVSNTTIDPYKKVCFLIMTFPNGQQYIGSGNLVSANLVLTAGHCVYSESDGGWATNVAVYPGNNGLSAPYGVAYMKKLMSVSGWTSNSSSQHDIGAIQLDRNIGDAVGWFGLTTDLKSPITLSGYHADLNQKMGTQTGNISRYTDNNVYYSLDSYGGSSGSGVYNSNNQILNVHAYGSTSENFGVRINSDKFSVIKSWIGNAVIATSITLNTNQIDLLPGGTSTLTVTVNPSNTTDKTITWSTSNSAIATVSNGVVKGIAVGNATITVKNAASGISATCAVSVRNSPATIIKRLYEKGLGRTPSAEEIDYHASRLVNGKATWAEVVSGFFLGSEYGLRKTNNETYVKDLYESMLGRTADESGLNYYITYLDNGVSRRKILAILVKSAEFNNVVQSFNCKVGELQLTEARDIYPKIALFVNKHYLGAFSTNADIDGLNYHTKRLSENTVNGANFALEILESPQYKLKNTNNEQFIIDIYATLFSRVPDADGKKNHLSRLNSGISRTDVLKSIINSEEYNLYCNSYGITRGTVK